MVVMPNEPLNLIAVTDDEESATRFNDIWIEGCTIFDVANEGIVLNNEKFEKNGYPGDDTWETRKFTHVVIRNNVIYRITKNAMIIRFIACYTPVTPG